MIEDDDDSRFQCLMIDDDDDSHDPKVDTKIRCPVRISVFQSWPGGDRAMEPSAAPSNRFLYGKEKMTEHHFIFDRSIDLKLNDPSLLPQDQRRWTSISSFPH